MGKKEETINKPIIINGVDGEIEVLEKNTAALERAKKGDVPAKKEEERVAEKKKEKEPKKKKVKKGQRGFFAITKYNLVTAVAYLVQVVLDKAGIIGKVLGAGLGQIATNHYNALCSYITRYIIDNELFRDPGFLKIFRGTGTFYETELNAFNEFIQLEVPTITQAMQGGAAVEGVIGQSILMNVIGTVIQFLIQNPVLILMPTAALGYEIIKKLVNSIKNLVTKIKNKKQGETPETEVPAKVK